MASEVDESPAQTARESPAGASAADIECAFREVSPHALATLIRLLGGDFDLA